jgi:hypothetical protein
MALVQTIFRGTRMLEWRSHHAARTIFQMTGVLRCLRPNARRLTSPLRMRRRTSTLRMVTAAFLGRLKPSIAPERRLTPRWSCSMRLFQYFDERHFVSLGNELSAFSSWNAGCEAA